MAKTKTTTGRSRVTKKPSKKKPLPVADEPARICIPAPPTTGNWTLVAENGTVFWKNNE